MRRPRRTFSPEFRAKVAIAALKGDTRVRQFEGQVVDFYGAHFKTLHYRLV
jgi:hypothetical protein